MDDHLLVSSERTILESGFYSRACSRTEYVPVIFARALPTAEHIGNVLRSLGVPALIDPQQHSPGALVALAKRIPVLVPQEMQDDASEIVAILEQQLDNGFDEDDEELDDDFFDDDDHVDDEEEYAEEDDDLYDDEELESDF